MRGRSTAWCSGAPRKAPPCGARSASSSAASEVHLTVVLELRDPPAPADACAALLDLPYPLLLDSTSYGGPLARHSYFVADPVRTWTTRPGHAGDLLRDLKAHLTERGADPVSCLPPFQGGVVGFLGYEYGRRLERLPAPRSDDLGLPDGWFGAYEWVVAWDHQAARAWVVAADAAAAPAQEVAHRLSGPILRAGPPAPRPDRPPEFRSGFTREEYLAAVERMREYILAGDIFQANLSQRFEAPWPGDPWDFYRRLSTVNPAPFSAYFRGDGFAVASASPERFLRVTAEGQVETRPIKGTRPRGATPEEDRRLAEELLASEKDRAENVMIVDLLRNDLSRVCRPGSVEVPALCTLEGHPTVHHLVSVVTGRLEEGATAVDLLRAAFPGGSITGAPKLRAMEILADLEPVARGVYCGTIGWLGYTGAMDTSIAIRTVTLKDGRAYFHAGGGVVADSDSALEYQETLDKSAGIRRAFGEAP